VTHRTERYTWRNSRGTIYFARHGDMPFVKIGFTRHMRNRMSTINRECSTVVEVVALLPGTPTEERELHKRFAPYNITGEWFLFVGEVRDLVENLAAGGCQ